jgi:hypothetical protein
VFGWEGSRREGYEPENLPEIVGTELFSRQGQTVRTAFFSMHWLMTYNRRSPRENGGFFVGFGGLR